MAMVKPDPQVDTLHAFNTVIQHSRYAAYNMAYTIQCKAHRHLNPCHSDTTMQLHSCAAAAMNDEPSTLF